MAEIRKYDPAVGNAIAEALRAAMGDPVRPVATGQAPAPAGPPPATDEDATTWVSLRITDTAPPEPAGE